LAVEDESTATAASAEAIEGAPSPSSPAEGAPDPAVSLAFVAGWEIAHLYARSTPRGTDGPRFTDALPGIGDLDEARRTKLALTQVKAALHALKDRLAVAGLEPASLQRVEEAYEGGPADELRSRIGRHHLELLQGLTAGDFRLGKAYSLGRTLADTCREWSSLQLLQTAFKAERVSSLQEFLLDLDSLFPAHSGRAVSLSLDDWRRWAADPKYDGAQLDWKTHSRAVQQSVVRQGHIWRALLSGEKTSTDMLALDDYLKAADRLFERARVLVSSLIRRYRTLFGGVAVAVAVAVVLLLESDGDAAEVVGGIGIAAAALGVTWKGVGTSLVAVGTRLQAPLWGVELDYAVAAAITRLPGTRIEAGPRKVEVPPSGPLESRLRAGPSGDGAQQ
jgi:hypothetical protein